MSYARHGANSGIAAWTCHRKEVSVNSIIFLESILVVLTINNLSWTYHLAELFRMLLLKCVTESNPSTWCYRSPFELQVSHVGIWVWGNLGEKENCQRILDKEQQPKLYGVVCKFKSFTSLNKS